MYLNPRCKLLKAEVIRCKTTGTSRKYSENWIFFFFIREKRTVIV